LFFLYLFALLGINRVKQNIDMDDVLH
jgi:hypothetical protein